MRFQPYVNIAMRFLIIINVKLRRRLLGSARVNTLESKSWMFLFTDKLFFTVIISINLTDK